MGDRPDSEEAFEERMRAREAVALLRDEYWQALGELAVALRLRGSTQGHGRVALEAYRAARRTSAAVMSLSNAGEPMADPEGRVETAIEQAMVGVDQIVDDLLRITHVSDRGDSLKNLRAALRMEGPDNAPSASTDMAAQDLYVRAVKARLGTWPRGKAKQPTTVFKAVGRSLGVHHGTVKKAWSAFEATADGASWVGRFDTAAPRRGGVARRQPGPSTGRRSQSKPTATAKAAINALFRK